MRRNTKHILLSLSFVSSVICIFLVWYLILGQSTLDLQQDTIQIEVKSGQTLSSVLQDLRDHNIITSTFWFRMHVKLHPQKAHIQAGFFAIPKNTTYKQLIDILQEASPQVIRVTFLEGWRVDEYIDHLGANGFDAAMIEDCLRECAFDYDFVTEDIKKYRYEGYLYPDTYFFDVQASAFTIIDKLLGRFDQLTASLEIPNDTLSKIITIASMIEREEKKSEEKYIVSGVMHNRLRDGIALGIDATVLYALDDWKAELNYTTLAIESPYNTRKYVGLPPSPICNPSVESIKAAFNPAPTDYYYYLHDAGGTTHFSKTLFEHNQKKALYLR